MRGRRRENPFSLFSFQDIITGLCGIMIFMVLVQVVGIVLERGTGAREPEEAPSLAVREAVRAEIARLEAQVAKVRAQAARAVVTAVDEARPGDVAQLDAKLTEKERIVAALVSQVHDLETQVAAEKAADAEDRAKIREMERTRRLLEQQIAGLKGRRGVTLIPERGSFKLPVYMVCSGAGIDVQRPFETAPRKMFEVADAVRELGDYLDALDHTTHAVVLLVRPSGIRMMRQVVTLLKERSFTYGRDPLEEDVEIAFRNQEGK